MWMKFEIWNIPWQDVLLDLASDTFFDAKVTVERAVSFYLKKNILIV
jgi:hypothetical protein